MFGLTSEQLMLIGTAVISLVSAISVAVINKRPDNDKAEIDKFGFFYDQYKILYDEAVNRVDILRIENQELSLEIEKLEQQVIELEEILEISEEELKELEAVAEGKILELKKELKYWKGEAKIAYKILEDEFK